MSQHPGENLVSGVGFTALMAAAARAVESTRPDRLIDDPLAAVFAAAAQPPPLPLAWPEDGASLSEREALLLLGAGYVGMRCRFFDDFLRAACACGLRQVVILAAGLDARAFRLDWPSDLRLFEIDRPEVLAFKEAVLRERGARANCVRSALATDLGGDWPTALRLGGFDPTAPTAWLAEGLLQYLPAEAERRLLGDVHELSAVGSQLALERSVDLAGQGEGLQRLRQTRQRTGIAMEGLVHTDRRPEPSGWLAAHGWSVADEPLNAVAERYHRNLTDPRLTGRLSADLRPGKPSASAQDPPAAGFTTASKGS